MPPLVPAKMSRIKTSEIRRVLTKATELEKAGQEIFHFEIGRPDFDTPGPIKAAAAKAMEAGLVHYAFIRGIPELRKAIAADAERLQIKVDPDREVMVTSGSSGAIMNCLLTLLEPGDEILCPEPMYLFYMDWAEFVGARTVPVPGRPEEGYQISAERLEAAVTPRTRVILINSPHNPTGAVLNDQSLSAVAEAARRHDLWVISDEVYDQIVFAPASHKSIASLPGMRERTFIINSFSKPFAMDGWRLGYLIGPAGLMNDLDKAQLRTSMGAGHFIQFGAVEALRRSNEFLKPMQEEYAARREICLEILKDAPKVFFRPPEGTFYLWLKVNTPLSDWEVAEYLLEKAGTAITPGLAFGASGRGHIRISFAVERDKIERGLRRLKEALGRLG